MSEDPAPKRDFGPSQQETWIYLWVSVGGLALLAVALLTKGLANVMAGEVVLMSLLFFGGTLIWAVRRLRRLG
ncbi:hypothetical protein [Jannaschia aquimarina]|uniref:Uncharacterized protein n=1 Tax=Jannaschia aquimarina TaxID=935700 RepID=A0A0D1CKR7_9RHOB|nr:hypothetical protein [Jannaschia aquimarina]KIT15372.1 hypothetical protein jaqu_28040 [Jannaschia aquimarina]SNT23272.1 hypothetical protein SAMN05421775_108110 [Jannaschia aquimarina]